MTVLWEDGECPPRKRLCLSASQTRRGTTSGEEVHVPDQKQQQEPPMAMPIEAGMMVVGGVDAVGGAAVRCGHDDCESPITTLSNLGNTCFLNSVLYTLRFAPSFIHNLHHLALDLKEYSGRHTLKCSSLGRGGKSWSSKDLPSLGGGDVPNVKMQIATDKLHQLYEALHTEELKDNMESYHPHVFLHSLRDVNPIFEGNQQHDAHELLVCLLDNIRETCKQLRQLVASTPVSTIPSAPPSQQPAKQSWSSQVRKSLSITRARPKINGDDKKLIPLGKESQIQNGDCCTNGVDEEDDHSNIGHNFISEHFEGVSLLKTTCLECEQVTQRQETFSDICVPITTNLKDKPSNVNKLYQNALVTEEYLHDSNKYWCEQCLRYNEAKRCVKFETLPKLLTLQIKRFSSGFGSVVSKVNEHMPTPLVLGCFCEKCQSTNNPDHQYHLYGVIMHLGATMASGHYVAYVKARDSSVDYDSCTRERRKTASLSASLSSSAAANSNDKSNSKRKWFSRQKNTSPLPRGQYFRSSCRGAECCGVKLRIDETSEPVWLECDDETVRTISKKQLEEILAQKQPKNSTLTPYLLFYARQ
ncbi:ubiquitin carboxyl-terminal hydrolase 1 isoform X2 [Cimex lectularius]|uniref:USP domain-containing protein n=1 Tax=Cimex lectularius TaxID=79782 RepID=A0A8I6RYS7_CIMLE|nr:ubiquitin carboxyl-terminal hydrolase 1 isoform X2 [Cimex lectularius]